MLFQTVASVVANFGRIFFDRACTFTSSHAHDKRSAGSRLLALFLILVGAVSTLEVHAQKHLFRGKPNSPKSIAVSLSAATIGIRYGQASTPSPEISFSVTGQATPVEVELSWQPPPSSPVAITGYLVLRALSSAGPFTRLESTAQTQTSYTDSSVGNGVTYFYQIESVGSDGETSVPSSTYEVLAATPITFGDQTTGSTSRIQKVTVTNTGNATLTFNSIGLTGTNANEFVASNNCGTILAASDSCTVSLHFSPTKTGAATAAISFSDNVTESAQSIPLTGTGVTVPTLVLTSSSNPASIGATVAFTATLAGTSVAPTGEITLLDGTTELKSGSLTNSAATYSTSSLAAGSHTIKAIYSGDDNYAPVTSSALTQWILGQTATIDFSQGFAQANGTMQFNGSTSLNGSQLHLTNSLPNEAGSAFYTIPFSVQYFATDFTFQLLNPAADGFTFTLESVGPAALGGSGGELGYTGIQHSVAIKFDLYNNGGEGNNSIGLYEGGSLPTLPAVNLTGTGISLHSGNSMHVHMTYDGNTLKMIITDLVTGAEATESWPLDITSALGGNTAWVGFTAGTGGLTSTQEVTSWTFIGGSSTPAYSSGLFVLGLTLNGSSTLTGTGLELTDGGSDQAGSAFFDIPLSVESFTNDFTFQITNPLADGFTLTIQNDRLTALGDNGGGLGYASLPESVAIKFDLYNNAGEGADSTGIYADGAAPNIPAVSLTGTGIDLHSGDLMAVHMTYANSSLNMTITDKKTAATWSHLFTIDLPSTLANDVAYFGFTGGTGGLSSTQTIKSWTYSPSVTSQ